MKIPLLKNTFTNYIGMLVRLLQGVLIVRWIIADLGEAQYGLWGLLWSFFCYALLLDFGMGAAAQKVTATGLWRNSIERYNRTVSTILCTYLLMSLVIIIITLIGAYFVVDLLKLDGVDSGLVSYYRACFICSGFGAALIFPLGVITEIVVGLQKMYLRNYINIVSKVVELAGIIIIFALGGGLLTLLVFSLIIIGVGQLALLYCCYRDIPGLRLRITLDWIIFKEIFHFSGAAYIISVMRMVWERGPAILLGAFCGLESVSTYLLGCRFPVMMIMFTGPYQENIAPLSALLHSHRKQSSLAAILLDSMRWNSFLATGLAIGVIIYSRVLIRALLGVESDAAVLISRITVVSVYLWLIFRFIPERYLLMAERHKFLAVTYIIDSVLFVLLSVLLLAAGVSADTGAYIIMITSILSRLFSTMALILPCMLKDTGLRLGAVLLETVFRPLLFSIPVILLALAEYILLMERINDFVLLCIAGLSCGPLYLFLAYRGMVSAPEKAAVFKKIKKFWYKK